MSEDQSVVTSWQHVRAGATVLLKGLPWKVTSTAPLTLVHLAHGSRTGTPKPTDLVTVLLPLSGPTTLAEAVRTVRTVLGGVVINDQEEMTPSRSGR